MNKEKLSILVLSPHADDESIGCGGFIAKLTAFGYAVDVLLFTQPPPAQQSQRSQEFGKALHVLGANERATFSYPEQKLVLDDQLLEACKSVVLHQPPDLLLAPHQHEQDPDHQLVHQVAGSLFAQWSSLAKGKSVCLLYYEVWSPLITPHLLVDISSQEAQKERAILAYESQLKQRSYDSILGLNHYRACFYGPGTGCCEAYGWHPDSRHYNDLCLF